jgi:hypothetical protein
MACNENSSKRLSKEIGKIRKHSDHQCEIWAPQSSQKQSKPAMVPAPLNRKPDKRQILAGG